MKKGKNERLVAINTLSNVSVIGFGLGLYEGRIWPMIVAAISYMIAKYLAKELDDAVND